MNRNAYFFNQNARKYLLIYPLIICLLLTILTGNAAFAAKKDRKAPTPPTGLQAVELTESSVSLKWNPSSDNVKVLDYLIYQGSTLIGSSAHTGYKVLGLTSATAYTYSIKARDTSLNLSVSSTPLTLTTLNLTQPTAQKNIIGYYASWGTYSNKQVADLDASKLTHINYAFANIGPDLKIALGDSYADVEKKFPDDTAVSPFYGNFNQLLKLKQKHPHLKTFISVGGWSWSARFSDAALTDASRAAFADSCVDFIVKYGFDGIDIDWEYPVAGGAAGNVKRPEDKQNFTLLMQKLREKLDEQSTKDGKTYLLSFAGAAGSYYGDNVELSKLQNYVDFINIMSYDIHGPWEAKIGFNAPLYKDPASASSWDIGVHDAVQLYLNHGVPAAKLVMGVPFYGYKYDGVANTNNGLYQGYVSGTSVTYAQIASTYLNQGYTRYFNEVSKVPYLYNGSSFITYDDAESLGYKADYINERSLGGVMIWELNQDTADRTLLNALVQRLGTGY
jgi:chitinase